MRFAVPICLAATLITMAQSCPATASQTTGVSNAVMTHIKRGAPSMADMDEIQKYVAQHPDDLEGHFILGELLASAGYQQLASDQFDLVSKRNPTYVLDQFHDLLKNHNYETARWIGYYVSAKYPKDSGVLFMIGRQALLKGQRRQCLEIFDKALQSKPVWPELYQHLAEVMFSVGRRDQAMMYADEALKIDPNDEVSAAVKVACQAELSGHPEKYLPQLEQYAARNWSNEDLSVDLAQAYVNTKQWDKAVKPGLYALKFGGALRLDQAENILKQCMAHVESGKMIEQLDHISPMNTRDFMSTVVRMRFAKLLSDIGAHKQSTQMLLQALQMHSYFAPALNYRLGKEMEFQHQYDDALFFYQTAYQMKQDEPKFKTAYDRAKMRASSNQNDLARKLKQVLKPDSKS